MGGMSGKFSIVSDDRLHNKKVLAGGGGKALRVVFRESAHAHEVSAQRIERPREVVVAHRVIDCGIEAPHQIEVRAAIAIVARQQFGNGGKLTLKIGEGTTRVLLGSEAHRFHFECFAHIKKLADVVNRHVSNDESPTGLACH